MGASGHRRPRAVHRGRRQRVLGHGRAGGVRRWRGQGLPLQPGDRRGDPARRPERRRARIDAAQRHLPAVLPEPHERRSEASVVARYLLRRADHGHRDDRAGNRIRPRVDDHDSDPGRRRLRRQRIEDVHHERDQRRPRDHGGEDRPIAAPPRHVAGRRRARHPRVRTGAQPRQGRHARAGHRRAVLHRRPGPRREPARRRGDGVRAARDEPAAGAPVDRQHRGGGRRATRSSARSST